MGGPGSIAPFETNLSLVISQTQEVHEEIVDLLEQLRRMQDLQVTIEVRFITLNDNFFERIGVDFDFNIMQNTHNPIAAGFGPVDHQPLSGTQTRNYGGSTNGGGTSVAGLQNSGSSPAQSRRLHLRPGHPLHPGQLRPGHAAVRRLRRHRAAPRWVLPSSATWRPISSSTPPRATHAATCCRPPRSRSSTASRRSSPTPRRRPFVISVIPVVGDFAAAQQPVIVVLSEGTFMTVQAVVSNDRRFVRLTIVPFFSKIAAVNDFTFQGSQTTTTDTTPQRR